MEVLSHELILTLNEVFKELTTGKLPRDDTLLEKVLTWMQKVLRDEASCERFLQSTDFTDCLNGVCYQEEIDCRVWAFLLRLAGHIASHLQKTRMASEFLRAVQTVFSKTVEQGHLWSQASVRCAWLNGLELWLSDDQFLSEAFVELILQSLEDSSWFVSKASVSLTSRILRNVLTSGEGSCQTAVLKHVLECLDLKDSALASNRQRFTTCMEVLERVCSEAVCYQRLCDFIAHDDLVSQLCSAIESAADERMNERCTAVLQVFSALWQLNVRRDNLREKLSELSQKLLLSAHLSMAMETAAWTLERFPNEAPNSVMLENICVLPLWISVRFGVDENDVFCLSSHPLDHDWYQNIVSVMNHSKARHTSLVKMSLTVIMQLQSHLIQRDLVFGLVKDILEQTADDSREQQQQQPLLQVNSRLKHQCLDVLFTILTTSGHDVALNALCDISHLIVSLLLQPDHDQVTVSKAYGLLLELLKVFGDEAGPQVDDILAKLPAVLQRAVNSLNWDIRDTAMDFIGKLMALCTEMTGISKWAKQNNFIEYISGGLKDSENFVRASALNALGIICHGSLFQSKKIKSYVQMHLWPEVMKLCQHDAETFSHRAAIELVAKCYTSRLMPSEEKTFENVMLCAISDSDWDVKLKAIAFWDAFAKDLFINGYSSGGVAVEGSSDLSFPMERLTESGCLKALLTATEDCDKSIQLQGLKALQNIKEQSAKWLKLTAEKTENSTNVEQQLSSNDLGKDQISSGVPLADIFNYLRFDQVEANNSDDRAPNAISLLRRLAAIDLGWLIVGAETSTDGHDGRPESLLDDLVKSLVAPVTYGSGFTSSEEDDNDEMAVDCY